MRVGGQHRPRLLVGNRQDHRIRIERLAALGDADPPVRGCRNPGDGGVQPHIHAGLGQRGGRSFAVRLAQRDRGVAEVGRARIA